MQELICLFELESLSVLVRNQPLRPPDEEGLYRLCPETVYDAGNGNFLLAVLDNTRYVCGNDGNPDDNCVIQGGSYQVHLFDNPPEASSLPDLLTAVREDEAGAPGEHRQG